jgi:hypothetical protein
MEVPPGLQLITDQNPSLAKVASGQATPSFPTGLTPAASAHIPPGLTPAARNPDSPPEEKKEVDDGPIDFQQMEWGEVINHAVLNLPKSAVETVKQTADALTSWQTIRDMGNLVAGAFQKAIPGEQGKEQYADLLIQFYTKRYGSLGGFKEAIATDPVGVILDGASILIPGGSAIKGVGTAAKIKSLTNLGKTLTKVGQSMDLMSAGVKSIGRVGALVIPPSMPLTIYQNAASFGEKMPKKFRDDLTRFAMDRKIMPTIKSVDKIQTRINLLNMEISDLIDRATLTGIDIPVKSLKKGFKKLHDDAAVTHFGKTKEARKALNDIQKDIWDAHVKKGSGVLTPAEAQKIKQSIYSKFQNYYTDFAKQPIEVEAFKLIAKNAKENIEQIFPELDKLKYVKEIKGKTSIKELNALESRYLKVLEAMEKPSGFNVGQLTSKYQQFQRTSLGHAMSPGQVGGLMLLQGFFNSRRIKARMALLARSLEQNGIPLSPAWTELGIIARTPVRIEEEDED